jgi:hypothetical protein
MKKIPFSLHSEIYKPSDIKKVLDLAVNAKNFTGNNKGEQFLNAPVSFDIETTSFYKDSYGETYSYDRYMKLGGKSTKMEKSSLMYVWQFGINGFCIIGRTWGEFITMMEQVVKHLNLSKDKRIIVYIHNLSYEFQFIRTLFEWEKVFSIDLRKPIYAITVDGIEFRCSYLLSGYSLAKLGEQLHKYKCAKMVGDLDYSLLRNTVTPLTQKEIGYCINDIKVVMCYIQELIENYKGITRLPITKTGFVRKYCRSICLKTKDETGNTEPNWDFIDKIHSLEITGIEEFNMLQRAFSGGFTHANAKYTDEVIENVDSYDFTSSYPYVMVSEKFPMSTGVFIPVKTMKQFDFLTSKYCCIFDVEFTNIFATSENENPISVSKCIVKENVAENNGRLVAAKRIVMTITEIDYTVFQNFYTWETVRIGKMICYRKEYLPTEFVKSILHLYEMKTKLKGVKGKEVEYLNSKEMLNSCYGMCVTNPLRDEILFENNEWDTEHLTGEQQLEMLNTYNKSKNRFLFYPWGIYVTAYARRNLFTGISECGDDYIYSDTDSVKIKNGENHKEYFTVYNMMVEQKLRKACNYHKVSFSQVEPQTIKGTNKLLGVWDYEGRYRRFKTLGAKRYMVEEDSALTVNGTDYNYSMTVSGVNKKVAIPYMIEKFGEDGIFDAFTNYLDIPPTATGKNIHTYIDYEQTGTLTDYLGNSYNYTTPTGVHLEPTGYTLSLSVMYLNYLMGIRFKK